ATHATAQVFSGPMGGEVELQAAKATSATASARRGTPTTHSGISAKTHKRNDGPSPLLDIDAGGPDHPPPVDAHHLAPRCNADAPDGDARRQRLPASRVGRVEDRQRGLGAERKQGAQQAPVAGGEPDGGPGCGAGDEPRDGADDYFALDFLPLGPNFAGDVDR